MEIVYTSHDYTICIIIIKQMENTESIISPVPVADIKSPTEFAANLPIKKDLERAFFHTEGDQTTIDSRPTALSEYHIRKEFVYLKLFQQMGLNVPNCELAQNDGKTSLAIEDLGPGLQINEISSKDQKLFSQLEQINLCSLALGINPETAKKTAITNENITVFKVLENDYQPPDYIQINRTVSSATEQNPEIIDNALVAVSKLTTQSVLDTVTESGLNDTDSHKIIKNILTNRDRILRRLQEEKGVKTEIREDEAWIKLDRAILESKGNDKFKGQTSTVKELSQYVKLLKDSFDRLIPKKRVDNEKNSIFSKFYSRMTYSIPELNSRITKSMDLNRETIDRWVTPTNGQLQTMVDFEKELINFQRLQNSEVPSFLTTFHKAIDQLSEHRKEFIDFSQKRSRSLVSHLSTYSGIKMALKSNLLESSLRQSEKGKEPFTNSPGGNRELLHQITFAVNGADLGYGGNDKNFPYGNSNTELSAGFVGLYSDVVRGNKFYEYSLRNDSYDGELHVFNSEHGVHNEKGIEIPIDKFILLVPENSKQDWLNFLQKPESTGGCGKDDEWVKKHIKTYPPKLTMDLYLRYFATPETLGLTPRSGTLVTDNEKIPYHQGQEATAFRWIDA